MIETHVMFKNAAVGVPLKSAMSVVWLSGPEWIIFIAGTN